jgi:transcription-repair coupling factor (superfamily II helicase)
MEMLEETIDAMRGLAHEAEIDPEIRLPVPARLPEKYVPTVNERLVLYKRLASCRDDAEVDRLRDEILDRYGPLPPDAHHLLEVIRLKIQARALGVAVRRRRERRDRAHRRREQPRRPAAPAAPTHAGRRRHPRDAGPQDPRADAQGPRAPGPLRRRAPRDDEPGRVSGRVKR